MCYTHLESEVPITFYVVLSVQKVLMLSIYKSATTWLQGVSHFVPACLLNLTSVTVLHPKDNVKLLLSLPQYTYTTMYKL